MPFNHSPLAFDDIREIFDRALASAKGVRVKTETPGAAVQLRHRMNAFRSLARRENAKIYPEDNPMHGRSVYDRLSLRVKKGEAAVEVLVLSAELHEVEEIE